MTDVLGRDDTESGDNDDDTSDQPTFIEPKMKAVLQRQLDDCNAQVEEMRLKRDEALAEVARLEGVLRARPSVVSVEYNPISSEEVIAAHREGTSSERFIQLREALRDAQIRERTATSTISRLEAELLKTQTDLNTARGECKRDL